MHRLSVIVVLISLPLLLLQSCGPTLIDVTYGMIEEGRNDEVIARMSRALLIEPDNNEYMKLLGIALYNKKDFNESVKLFKKVLDSDDEDDQAAYFLGATYEALQDYDKAIQYYRVYNELSSLGEYKQIVEARIKVLYKQQMEKEARLALQIESQLDVAKVPTNTIAILYFENKGAKRELDPLQKGLAEMIITDLTKVNALRVVERVRLQKLIEEMNLSETDLVDPKTAPRMGKLLGAYRLVKGTFFDLAGEKVRIDALVAKTKTGDLDATTNISGNLEEFFRLEKELVFQILKELNISINNAERESILEVPTENFFAFLQYSRGLDYEDRGMYQQAYQAYNQAAAADPKFSMAKSNAVSAKKTEEMISTSSTSDNTTTTDQPADQPSGQQSSGTSNRSSSSSSRSSTSSSAPGLTPMAPPPPSSSFGPGSSSGVTDRLGNMNNVINQTTNPGTNTQNQPPRQVVVPLPDPPKPPGN